MTAAVWYKIMVFPTAAQATDQTRWDMHLPIWLAVAAAAALLSSATSLYDDWKRICFKPYVVLLTGQGFHPVEGQIVRGHIPQK